MASADVVFNVGMTCSGCSGAVTRILTAMDGVESVDCDIEGKRVTVKGSALPPKEEMFEKLKKWGEASGKSVAYGS